MAHFQYLMKLQKNIFMNMNKISSSFSANLFKIGGLQSTIIIF